MIAIIGASGFIGRHLQEELLTKYKNLDVVMVYFKSKNNVDQRFNNIDFDDFVRNNYYLQKVKTIILVAGCSNSNITISNLRNALIKDTQYIYMLNKFNANLILLSSAAVYDGYIGEVSEEVQIKPKSLYGICKLNAEFAANDIMEGLENKNLLIFRLMYAYGHYEKDNRLIPLVASCIKNNKQFYITGYNNIFNPLPARAVSKALIEAALNINLFESREIINLSNIYSLTVEHFLKKIISPNLDDLLVLYSEYPKLPFWNSITKLKEKSNLLKLEEKDFSIEEAIKYLKKLLE